MVINSSHQGETLKEEARGGNVWCRDTRDGSSPMAFSCRGASRLRPAIRGQSIFCPQTPSSSSCPPCRALASELAPAAGETVDPSSRYLLELVTSERNNATHSLSSTTLLHTAFAYPARTSSLLSRYLHLRHGHHGRPRRRHKWRRKGVHAR